MKENKGMWAALAAVLPALALAGAGWIQADTARKEAETQTEKKLDLAENYGEYIEDRMKRDEALQKALETCMGMLQVAAFAAPAGEMPSPDVDLDDVAEDFGYEQGVAP